METAIDGFDLEAQATRMAALVAKYGELGAEEVFELLEKYETALRTIRDYVTVKLFTIDPEKRDTFPNALTVLTMAEEALPPPDEEMMTRIRQIREKYHKLP